MSQSQITMPCSGNATAARILAKGKGKVHLYSTTFAHMLPSAVLL